MVVCRCYAGFVKRISGLCGCVLSDEMQRVSRLYGGLEEVEGPLLVVLGFGCCERNEWAFAAKFYVCMYVTSMSSTAAT